MENKYALTLIHGSKEHWKRYKNFIRELESKGIRVTTGDLATHGDLFKGENHNFTFQEMLDSAIKLVDESRIKYPDHKQIIMGHSMGSFITKYIVYKNLREFDGVVLSGTNDLKGPLSNIALISTSIAKDKVWRINEDASYGMLSKASKRKGFGESWLSARAEIEKAFDNDPLCGNDFTNGSLNAMFRFAKYNGTKKTLKEFKNKHIPQLVLYGEEDPVTNFGIDIKSMVKRHNKYGIDNHRVISYPGCKHEIAFGPMRDKVAKDIIDFIKAV